MKKMTLSGEVLLKIEKDRLRKKVNISRYNGSYIPKFCIHDISGIGSISKHSEDRIGDFEECSVYTEVNLYSYKDKDHMRYNLTKDLNDSNKRVFMSSQIHELDIYNMIGKYNNLDLDILLDTHLLQDIYFHRNAELPCVPSGIIRMFDDYRIRTAGKKVVLIGRDYDVGIPLMLALIKRNATVSLCHKSTKKEDLVSLCKNADILISATGIKGFVTEDMIKDGSIFIDVSGVDIDYSTDITSKCFLSTDQYTVDHFARVELLRRFRESLK